MNKIGGKSLSSKFQITVPKTIRDVLGLSEGDSVDYIIEDDRVYIQKTEKVYKCPCCENGRFFGEVCKVCEGSGSLKVLSKESLIAKLATIVANDYNASFSIKNDGDFVNVDVETDNQICEMYVEYFQMEFIKLGLMKYKAKDLANDDLKNKLLGYLKMEESRKSFKFWWDGMMSRYLK